MSNNSNENLYVNQEMVNNQEESKDDMTYYTIPNKVESPKKKKMSTSDSVNVHLTELPEDAETRLAKALIEGDSEASKDSIKESGYTINSSKIHHLIPDELQSFDVETISPLDLAAHFRNEAGLDQLLDQYLDNLPQFEDFLKSHSFLYSNVILDKLVVKSPKLAEELLNQKVMTSQQYSDEPTHNDTLVFDFGLFRVRNNTIGESVPILRMLDEGHRDLVKQPVSEAFVHFKWQKLCWTFYLAFAYRICLALVLTLSTLFEVSRHPLFVKWAPVTRPGLTWILIAAFIPAMLHVAFKGVASLASKSLTIPSLSSVVQCGLLASLSAYVALILTQSQLEALHHSATWAVFLSWTFVLLKVSEWPRFGIYVHILRVVLQDVLAFLVSVLALILGFAFAFHLLDKDGSSSPIAAFLSVLTMIVGHYYKDYGRLPGTAEVIFVLFFILLGIATLNIMIGICVANVKDMLSQKEDYKLGQMVLNNIRTEEMLLRMSRFCSQLKCCPWLAQSIVKLATLLYHDDHLCYKVWPYANRPSSFAARRRTVLPLRFGNDTSLFHLPVFLHQEIQQEDNTAPPTKTQYTLPAWIWENSRPILEERHEMERARAEEERNKSAQNEDDYTSLYWNPGKDAENEYEVVDQENSRYFGSGILRGIKESLLRELRRDLARFARPIVYRSSRHGQKQMDSMGKCVNLRPGLALGVITLQAGSRQRIAVH